MSTQFGLCEAKARCYENERIRGPEGEKLKMRLPNEAPSLGGLEDNVKTIHETPERKDIDGNGGRTEAAHRANLGRLTTNRVSSKRK